MKKILSIVSALVALAIGFSSCSDDDGIYRNHIGSHVSDGYSVCYIPSDYLDLDAGTSQLQINLLPQKGDREYSVIALVKYGVDAHLIKLPLEQVNAIPDGIYVMSGETMSGEKLKKKLNVEFKDNMLQCINYVMASYPMPNGSGTFNDPYKIESAEDFDMFKYGLKNDSEKGKGQYFVQTASFTTLYDFGDTDRGYGCEEFAGNFDGGNQTITYEYFGSGADTIDSNRGLFSVLRDGANISNLKIRASMKNIRYNAGALAGVVNGSVKISKVYFHSDIASLSGYDASRNIGGLIGKVENASLKVDVGGTYDKIISVSGKNSVGGLIGAVVNSNFEINNVEITHEISSANQDVTPIYTSGDCVGGLIGVVESTSGVCQITNSEVNTAVKAIGNHVGGFIGRCNSNYTVSVSDSHMSSFVRGDKKVGGFVGEFTGSGRISLYGNNSVEDKNIGGVELVGGLIGRLQDAEFVISGTTQINLGDDGIIASNNRVGGMFGELVGTDVSLYHDEIVFNNALEVSGNRLVGGLVGNLIDSELKGYNSISFSNSIPHSYAYHANFNAKVTGTNCVGGAVGFAKNSVISSIFVDATVVGTDSVAGIVGAAELSTTSSVISFCAFDGEINAGSGKDIGGICGKFTKDGMIYYSINYGTVNGRENVGGIAGAANYGETTQSRIFFQKCVNVGKVTGSEDVGGIVGYMHGDDYYVHVESCANYGDITGNTSTTGGIVGLIPSKRGRIYYCVNHGSVTSTEACCTGGIIGEMGEDPVGAYQSTNLEIGWCANTGNVTCLGDSEVGGIVGFAQEGAVDWNDQDSYVHDCYNTGTISESGGEAGGIIGYSDRYCYLKCLANYGETDYAIVGDYKYGPDLYDDYTYYTKGSQTNNIADTYLSDPSNQDNYDGFDFSTSWQMYGGKAILQDSKCPFQNKTYTP